MKIIVAHPGRQHSYRLASALKKNGMLAYYCTTIYDKPSSGLMKLIKKFLSKDNLKRANGRRNPDLEDCDVIQYCEFGGMLEVLLSRIDNGGKLYFSVQQINADRFGKKVAKLAIKNQVDAVVCYDTNSLACFKYLKKKSPHIKRIMDVSIASRPYIKKIYDAEFEATGNKDLYKTEAFFTNTRLMARLEEELSLSQYFLAASQFVKNSLIYSGVSEKQILVVPYGANVESNISKDEKADGAPINFLFVGQINYRKGIPTLLEAFSKLDHNLATLTLTGAYNKDEWFVKKHKENPYVNFMGLVTPDKMKSIYESADVFVIDSFAEGMAQVGIEAMACGLPIICSENSGVNDIVTYGENGFIIPCGDSEILAEKMQWFIDNRDKIVIMGEKARKIAKQYTWKRYENNISETMQRLLSNKTE